MYTGTNFLEQEFEPSKTMVVKWPENYELPSGSYNALVWDVSQRINPDLGPSIFTSYDPDSDVPEETFSPFGEK